jgi:membrane associated rhomboid family serine protease
MRRRPASRLEPLTLGLALSSPLAMLALVPGGRAAIVVVLLALVPLSALYGLYRLAVRGRPRPARRPVLVPPPVPPAPPGVRAATFRLERGGRVVREGTLDELVALAREGAVQSGDLVARAGVAAAAGDLADLAPHVPSGAEVQARRVYLGYLAAALGAGLAGVGGLLAARLAGAGLDERSALLVLLFAAALAPLLALRREWRRLEAGRALGLVPEPPPRLTLGSAALDAAVAGSAPATRRVLAGVVAVSAAALLLPPDVLVDRLAKDNEAIRDGEVWRLLTAGLVHGGALHLFMNAAVLANVGAFVERLLGARRMLAVLFGGVLGGSLASFATNPQRSVGISGGLFALVGALLVVGVRHRRALPPPARRMLVRAPLEIIVLNVALGLVLPVIDDAAHLGGLAAGLLLGLALGVPPRVAEALRRPPPGGAAPPGGPPPSPGG